MSSNYWYCGQCSVRIDGDKLPDDERCDDCTTFNARHGMFVRLPGVPTESQEASRVANRKWLVDITMARMPCDVEGANVPFDTFDVGLYHDGEQLAAGDSPIISLQAVSAVNSWRVCYDLKGSFIRLQFVWRTPEGEWPDELIGPSSWMTYIEFLSAVRGGI